MRSYLVAGLPALALMAGPGCATNRGASRAPAAMTAFAAPTVTTSTNAACAPYSAEQKAEALAIYGKNPPELVKDTSDVATLEDAYGHGLDPSPDVAMAQLMQYPVDLRHLAATEQKYGAFMCAERESLDGPSPLERQLKSATLAFQGFRKDLERRAAAASEELNERLGSTETRMLGYKAKSAAVDEKKRSLLGDSTSDIRESLRGAEVVLRALEITRGRDAADTVRARARVEATRATLNRINDDIATANLAAAPAPQDGYFAADRAAIKSAVKRDWAARYPTERVVGIYVTGAKWNHKAGTYFRDRDNRVVQFDNSFLPVTVVVADTKNDKVGDVYTYEVRRDHLEGNALKTDYSVTREKVSKVLLKKVK